MSREETEALRFTLGQLTRSAEELIQALQNQESNTSEYISLLDSAIGLARVRTEDQLEQVRDLVALQIALERGTTKPPKNFKAPSDLIAEANALGKPHRVQVKSCMTSSRKLAYEIFRGYSFVAKRSDARDALALVKKMVKTK